MDQEIYNTAVPNWEPLKKTIGAEKCGDFMFMYSTVHNGKTVCAYKNICTRRYLLIDTEDTFYSSFNSPIEKEEALQYVYS